jgi:hypothetical protein
MQQKVPRVIIAAFPKSSSAGIVVMLKRPIEAESKEERGVVA